MKTLKPRDLALLSKMHHHGGPVRRRRPLRSTSNINPPRASHQAKGEGVSCYRGFEVAKSSSSQSESHALPSKKPVCRNEMPVQMVFHAAPLMTTRRGSLELEEVYYGNGAFERLARYVKCIDDRGFIGDPWINFLNCSMVCNFTSTSRRLSSILPSLQLARTLYFTPTISHLRSNKKCRAPETGYRTNANRKSRKN